MLLYTEPLFKYDVRVPVTYITRSVKILFSVVKILNLFYGQKYIKIAKNRFDLESNTEGARVTLTAFCVHDGPGTSA